ncbi:hydrogenase expression/formation protein HypE, partial [Streptomyces sp. NPDC127044]
MSETTGTTTELRTPVLDPAAWTCPAPLRDQPRIVMGHGGGGALSAELVQHVFAPAFGGEVHAQVGDAAALSLGGVRMAFSTDSFVVRPRVLPPRRHRDHPLNSPRNKHPHSGAPGAKH